MDDPTRILESQAWYSQEPEPNPTKPLDDGSAAEWVEDEDDEPTF